MKTLRNTLMTLLATGTIVAATTASALPAGWVDSLTAWTATASSCAVDESSAGKYEFNLSQFRYLGANFSDTTGRPPLSTLSACLKSFDNWPEPACLALG